ncbi:hypothetical protein DSO57_1007891 [Entomophthora muscae]|uniref:Uncharacterized protein n=1 Tax=Entomophthora muscae TaxID=34485 RepID=A0ACC2SKN3_9FUNG|nr:hypothetical protein DSO57_1007891 [Entomophthora muscae]
MTTLAQCKPFTPIFSLLGNVPVDGGTRGFFSATQTMQIAPSATWIGKRNFSTKLMDLGKEMDCNTNKISTNEWCRVKHYYFWDGGHPITKPVACYENEKCHLQLLWRSDRWKLITWKDWIYNSFKVGLDNETLVHNKSGFVFTHIFYGPQEHTVLFNKIQLLLVNPFFFSGMHFPKPKSGKLCDVKQNGIPQGVLTISKGKLNPPI